MALTPGEKELAAVGMSLASGCKPCTDFHVGAARKAGASDAQIKQAMDDALAVRREAADIMQAHGLVRLESGRPLEPAPVRKTDRVKELVCIGAAFAVNCVSSLKAHLDAAEGVGISHDEITAIVKLSTFIKGKAASHVEHLAASIEHPEAAYEKAVSACC